MPPTTDWLEIALIILIIPVFILTIRNSSRASERRDRVSDTLHLYPKGVAELRILSAEIALEMRHLAKEVAGGHLIAALVLLLFSSGVTTYSYKRIAVFVMYYGIIGIVGIRSIRVGRRDEAIARKLHLMEGEFSQDSRDQAFAYVRRKVNERNLVDGNSKAGGAEVDQTRLEAEGREGTGQASREPEGTGAEA